MSHSFTEAGNVSNHSIFSDSQELDAAEKPVTEPSAIVNENEEQVVPEHPAEKAQPNDATTAEMDIAPISTSALMKPRRTAYTQPSHWESGDLTVPEDDQDDEFDIGTVQRPVYHAAGEKPKVIFLNNEPDMKGEVTNCFDEDGLLYRLVDKRKKTWAFYNDSLAFEVHVNCTFGKHSKISPLENTKMISGPDGEHIAEVIVYPGETELFVKGYVNGFSSKLRAVPLSDGYYLERSQAQWNTVVAKEIQAVRDLAGDETDPEVILRKCIETQTPFVDLSFLPVQASIDFGSSKPFKPLPWARPTQYLKSELHSQIRLFRKTIVPGDVDPGELGDCWLLCALAIQAEKPSAIMEMFHHPKGANEGRLERSVGAYRVTFNKNGLWHSVLVDDYLPVICGTPKFARSSDPCELWPSILQKAYAKLHQSYAKVQSGDPVQALTDMNGYPNMRFDEDFADVEQDGSSKNLYDRLVSYSMSGYQIIFTTAGKAPAITPGTRHQFDFSEENENEESIQGSGLLPGHAYGALAVRTVEVDGTTHRLVKMRNAWPYGDKWEGPWSNGSDLWQQHPHIAEELHHDAANPEMNAQWMPWETVLKYFIGGGVVFCSADHKMNEVRVPISFADCRPSIVLEVCVSQPTRVCVSLANIDHRVMDLRDAPASSEYPAVMLSLASPFDASGDDVYKVVANTSANPAVPSADSWTFLQTREIGMALELLPSASPYLIIPRLMEDDKTLAGGNGVDFEQFASPVHFVNSTSRTCPTEDVSGKKVIPATLSVLSDVPLLDGQLSFRHLSSANAVFENFPKFPTDDLAAVTGEVYFQTKDPNCGYAQEKMGKAPY